MTIGNETVKSSLYIGNGITNTFAFSFWCKTAENIDVYKFFGNDTTLLVKDSDYIVTLNSNQDTSPGGSILLTTPLASGYNLRIYSSTPGHQGYDITSQNAYNPQSLENSLDKLTLKVNELSDTVSRCVKAAPIRDGLNFDIPQNMPLADKVIMFDGSGNVSLGTVSEATFIGEYFNSPAFLGNPTAPTQSISNDSTRLATTGFVWDVLNAGGVGYAQSISDLKTKLKTSYASIVTSGYYASGDGGAAIYRLDPLDTTTIDNGVTVHVAADGGRWKLFTKSDIINAAVAGIKAEIGFNNSSLLTTALANFNRIEFSPSAGEYEFTSRVTIAANKTIAGNKAKFKKTNGDWLFDVTGSDAAVFDFQFTGSSTLGGGVVLLRTDLSAIERFTMARVVTFHSSQLIGDAGGANSAINVTLYEASCRVHRGVGVAFSKVFAYLKMFFVTIDYVGSSSRNHTGFSITGNEGAFIYSCDVTGGLVDGTTTSNHGFAFQNCKAVWLTNCMADTVGGKGFYIVSGCQYIYFLGECVASLCGDHGLAISGGSDYEVNSIFVNGRVGQAYAPANIHGIHLTSAIGVSISKFKSQSNNGDGIRITNSTVTISGGRSVANTGRGLDSTGTNVMLCTGVTFVSNTVGNINQSSANMHTTACQQNSGALLSLSVAGSA